MAKRISILVALEGADEGLKRAITSASPFSYAWPMCGAALV